MQDQMNGKSLPATELHNPRPLVSEKPKSQYATPAHNTRPFSQQPSGLQTPIFIRVKFLGPSIMTFVLGG